MKKLAAAIVAVVMIVGAVLVRRGLDDHQKVAERVTVICAQTIAPACTAWRDAGANITGSADRDFSTLKAADLAGFDLVIGPTIVTSSLLDTATGSPRLLASSPIVVISSADSPVCPDGRLKCLAALPATLAWAIQKKGELGADVMTALTNAAGDDVTFGDLLVSSRVDPVTSITPAGVQNAGNPAAAVLTRISVGAAANLSVTPVVPSAQVGISGFVNADAPSSANDTLADPRLTAALSTADWLVK